MQLGTVPLWSNVLNVFMWLPRLERTGYVNAVSDFFSGLWNGKTDPCEEYYIATMVDPFFEVSWQCF